MKKLLCLTLALVLALSFTAFAADFICLSTTVDDGSTVVSVKEGKITFTLSGEIDEETLSTVTMTVDGEPFDGFSATLNGTTAFDVNFLNDLDYSMPYVISFANVKSVSEAAVSGKNTLSFTTEAKPDIEIVGDIALTKGIGSAVEDVDYLSTGSVHGFKVTLKNNTSAAKTVNIVCAIYNENGIIEKVLTSEKAIDATATEVLEIGTLIKSEYLGGKAKIYVWDNLTNKSPFVGYVPFDIY